MSKLDKDGFILFEVLVSLIISTIIISGLLVIVNNLLIINRRFEEQYYNKLEIEHFTLLIESIKDQANRNSFELEITNFENGFEIYLNKKIVIKKEANIVITFDNEGNETLHRIVYINDFRVVKIRRYNIMLILEDSFFYVEKIFYIVGGVI